MNFLSKIHFRLNNGWWLVSGCLENEEHLTSHSASSGKSACRLGITSKLNWVACLINLNYDFMFALLWNIAKVKLLQCCCLHTFKVESSLFKKIGSSHIPIFQTRQACFMFPSVSQYLVPTPQAPLNVSLKKKPSRIKTSSCTNRRNHYRNF